jgi:hypothetical protein
VWMVSLEEAAALVCTTVEILTRRIENRTLHCMKPSAETLLICCDSLSETCASGQDFQVKVSEQ